MAAATIPDPSRCARPRRPRTLLLALLLVAAAGAGSVTRPVAAQEAPRTRLVLLGTGTPNADPARSGPALAVIVDDVPYLVDAGPGVVRRAAAAAAQGHRALAVQRLARVFITHLHSDHTLGLPDLLFTPWVLERVQPLRVWGPPGTARLARHVSAAWEQDRHMRLFGLEPANDGGHRIVVEEMQPGGQYRDERVTVHAFPVRHGSWPAAYGYRFETPDGVIVISGDTAPADSVVEACDGCDILVHEVYARAGWERREPVWQRYHAAFHTSGIELGRLASRARPKLLVLTHQLLWGASEDTLLGEVREHFDGRVVSGRDLDSFPPLP